MKPILSFATLALVLTVAPTAQSQDASSAPDDGAPSSASPDTGSQDANIGTTATKAKDGRAYVACDPKDKIGGQCRMAQSPPLVATSEISAAPSDPLEGIELADERAALDWVRDTGSEDVVKHITG